MTRTITSLTLTETDSPYTLTDGLWLEFRDGQWTLNDANTSIPVGSDEDLDTITADWLKAVTG